MTFKSVRERVGVMMWGDTSPEEKRLIRKLDFFILSYSCLSYFFNFLDRQAFANAYVTGLREALDLKGTDYNVLLIMTTAGMLVGQLPNALAIQKIPPRIWLPSMVLVWAMFTMLGAACKTFSQLCAVRFLMGFAEASTYPGCMYIMGSWYKPNEIAKRTAVLTAAGQIGSMFAGLMMAAIYNNMNGYAGLAGWQWVFIIDGIITCPIALYGFLYFPDTPETTRASYLRPEEKKLALARLPPKKPDGHNISPMSLAKRLLGQPAFYICCFFSFLSAGLQNIAVNNLMLLYLKDRQVPAGLTQTQINTWPLGIQGVGVISEFATAALIDYYGQRMIAGLSVVALQVVAVAILIVPGMLLGGNMAGFYLTATSYAINPLLYGWSSNITARGGDDAARAVILAGMVAGGMVLGLFWNIVFYPASDAPYWRKGYITMFCVAGALGLWLLVVRWLDNYTARKYGGDDSVVSHDVDDANVVGAPETKTGEDNASTDDTKTGLREKVVKDEP